MTETPAHKQKPNQTWQRQERWRRRTHTVTADVTVIQESPDKKTVDVGKGKLRLMCCKFWLNLIS